MCVTACSFRIPCKQVGAIAQLGHTVVRIGQIRFGSARVHTGYGEYRQWRHGSQVGRR